MNDTATRRAARRDAAERRKNADVYANADIEADLHPEVAARCTGCGVVNAVTAYSQGVEDGDTAHDLEARATALLL